MNDYWLSAQVQWRTEDIRREFAHIRLAQSVSPSKSSSRSTRLLRAIRFTPAKREKGGSHERAGRAILAVD